MTEVKWNIYESENDYIHITPAGDALEHLLKRNCLCDPNIDLETKYEDRPVLIHNEVKPS